MENFKFYAPTKVYFGKDEDKRVGKILKEFHPKKVLIHYGGQSAIKSGLLDRVKKALDEENIAYCLCGGVVANPLLSKVNEGIQICKEEGVDFILAVGGGSVLDSSKGIAYGVYNEGNVWDYYARKKKVKGALPMGCILTLAATGSEMSNSSVITNEDGNLKRGLSSEYGYFKFSILNPELTYTVSKYQTMCGCTDIIMHTFERYFTPYDTLDLVDQMAESLVRTVIANAKILLEDPTNEKARAEIMWAGSVSHNDMTGDRSLGDWACHQLEHELSGMFNVAHGAGLAAIWDSWANHVYMENPTRFAKLGHRVFGLDDSDTLSCALNTIEKMEEFFKSIGMPTSIQELLKRKCTEQELYELTYKCSFEHTRTIGKFKELDETDMLEIYRMANEKEVA